MLRKSLALSAVLALAACDKRQEVKPSVSDPAPSEADLVFDHSKFDVYQFSPKDRPDLTCYVARTFDSVGIDCVEKKPQTVPAPATPAVK